MSEPTTNPNQQESPFASNRVPTLEEIWRRYDADERRLSAPLSQRMLELAGAVPGMQVLDIAAGRGEPAIPAAKRVGTEGVVLGVDIEPSMLEMARERATAEGVLNLELQVRNAEKLEGIENDRFDIVLCRWGLMYFQSPVSALREIARTIKPEGRFVAAMWSEPERVDYYTLPRNVLQQYKPIPSIDFESPGTFRYASPSQTVRDFELAGLEIKAMEEIYVPVMEARSDEELIAWTRAFGLQRLLNDLPAEIQMQWEQDLIDATRDRKHDDVTQLGGVTRLVVAERTV